MGNVTTSTHVEFQMLTDEEVEESEVMVIPDDSPRRYILQCDLGKYYFYFSIFMYIS